MSNRFNLKWFPRGGSSKPGQVFSLPEGKESTRGVRQALPGASQIFHTVLFPLLGVTPVMLGGWVGGVPLALWRSKGGNLRSEEGAENGVASRQKSVDRFRPSWVV